MPPAPSDIKLKKAERALVITWPDGSAQTCPVRRLRCACRCAGCVDERTGVRTLDVDAVPQNINITDMKLVGSYAIQFTFTDGHDTGIYTWEHLREVSSADPG